MKKKDNEKSSGNKWLYTLPISFMRGGPTANFWTLDVTLNGIVAAKRKKAWAVSRRRLTFGHFDSLLTKYFYRVYSQMLTDLYNFIIKWNLVEKMELLMSVK